MSVDLFSKGQIETDESEPGIHIRDIGRAVMIWAAMDPWLYLRGDQIEMDGE